VGFRGLGSAAGGPLICRSDSGVGYPALLQAAFSASQFESSLLTYLQFSGLGQPFGTVFCACGGLLATRGFFACGISQGSRMGLQWGVQLPRVAYRGAQVCFSFVPVFFPELVSEPAGSAACPVANGGPNIVVSNMKVAAATGVLFMSFTASG
jgi:hypothetical protein